MKTHEVELHYSTHITLRVKAGNKEEAITKAEERVSVAVNRLTEDALDLLWNLESRRDADRARMIKEV